MSNVFLPFAVVPTGASGPGAALDLFALAPPTGLDRHLTFLCTGDFKGALSVEGSSNGTDWDVVTQFDAGQDADGIIGPKLEFSPKLVSAVVRFLRTNARGAVVSGPTQISVGAAQNCECDGSAAACGCACGDIYRVTDEFDEEPMGNSSWQVFGDVKLIPAQGGAWRLTVTQRIPNAQTIALRTARSFAFAGNAGNIPVPALVFRGRAYYDPGINAGDGFAAIGLADFAHLFVLAVAAFNGQWTALTQAGGPPILTPLGIPVGDTCASDNLFEIQQLPTGDVRFMLNGTDLGVFPVPPAFRAHLYAVVGFLQGPSAFAIDDATNATPIVIQTTSPHGYVTGQTVIVSGVGGNGGANGTFVINVLDATHFELVGSVGTGAYTSGGQVILASTAALTLESMCAAEGRVCLDDPGDVPFASAGDLIQTKSNYQSNDIPDNADTVNWTTVPVAVNLDTSAGNAIVAWAQISTSQDTAGESNEFRWIIDGVPLPSNDIGAASTFDKASVPGATIPPATSFPQGNVLVMPRQMLPAGPHSVGLQWRVSGGTGLWRPGTFPSRESASILVFEVAV